MKYNQPPGEATDAAYIDGNRNAGTKGSVVPAAAVEFPQRELVNLINFAGLTPDNADLEQVRKAIETLISAATGGGDTSQFLLVSQARARLPIFPEILSSDGRMNVTSPGAGSILVPPTVAFQHRGIFPANTSDYTEPNRTFATVSNKTYHLRWNPTDGFELKDVANATYNPDAVGETDARFDSGYDDMLVARIVTNASNVATIANLANKPSIKYNTLTSGVATKYTNNANTNDAAYYDGTFTFNFARTPVCLFTGASILSGGQINLEGYVNRITNRVVGRYGATARVSVDYYQTITGSVSGEIEVLAVV